MSGKIILLFMVLCACALSHAVPARRGNHIEGICTLPLIKGHCRALMSRWMYDPNERKCVAFEYGGCAGNANNFMSQDDCMTACEGV